MSASSDIRAMGEGILLCRTSSTGPDFSRLLFNIRCRVLDDIGFVTQSFSVGSRVAAIDDETTENGLSIVNGLNRQFEYLRQYMEQGPSALSYPDLVSTKVSFANPLRIWRHDDRAILAERNLFTTLLLVGSVQQ